MHGELNLKTFILQEFGKKQFKRLKRIRSGEKITFTVANI